MAIEIERKFLVVSDAWRERVETSTELRQGYLCGGSGTTVRVRIAHAAAWITVKGPTHGVSRVELEYPVPLADADLMLRELCRHPLVEKTRHVVVDDGRRWEIDEFTGENRGLVVAEVELESSQAEVHPPPWAGAEVSGEPRYYNAALSERPFTEWTEDERNGTSAPAAGDSGGPGQVDPDVSPPGV